MKVKILEYDEEKEAVFEIIGEGHTFANAIRDSFCEVKEVDSAGYFKEHPFVEKAKLIVKAAPKKKLDKAVKAASKDLAKKADEFYSTLEKAL
ncbi:MAG: RpoL/Rpb11 RNA polymerase subunit family protein [Asgard group archaeon]|nr:RpoL/Rpb11 RNA polymerase subunit family protein [Asgard group archaeon]